MACTASEEHYLSHVLKIIYIFHLLDLFEMADLI